MHCALCSVLVYSRDSYFRASHKLPNFGSDQLSDILHDFLRYLLRILVYYNRPRRHPCTKLHDSLLMVIDCAAVIFCCCCCCCYHHHQQQQQINVCSREDVIQHHSAVMHYVSFVTCCVQRCRFHSMPELLTLKTAKGTRLVLRN